jgi:predicted RND superfamily exporter protein
MDPLSRFVELLVANRVVSLLVFAILTLAIVAGSLRLSAELTGREFFAHREDEVARFADFVDRWGDDSNLLVAVADAGDQTVLTSSRMQAMAGLAYALRDIEGVDGAWSLQEFPRFQKSPDGMARPTMVLGAVPTDVSLLQQWQQTQLADPLLVPGALSVDGRYAVLIVQLNEQLDAVDELVGPVTSIKAAVSGAQGVAQLHWELTGLPAIRVALLEVIFENQAVLVPLSMLLVISLLAFFYRRLYAVALPVVAGLLAVILLLGVMGWTGEPIGLLNQFYFTLIPVIVMVDGVHVIERFAADARSMTSHADIVKAVVSSYASVGKACFLTSLTTAVGFMSLAFGNIAALRHFGLYAALGILFGFVLLITLMPLALSRVTKPDVRATPIADGLLHSIASIAVAAPRQVLIAALIALLGLITLASRVEPGNTLTGDLPADESASVGGRLLDSHLSGLFQFHVVLQGQDLDSFAVLEEIDKLEARWRGDTMIRSVTGPGTAIRHASRWIAGGEDVPVDEENSDDYYRGLFEFSELLPVMSEDGEHARVVVTAPDQGTTAMLRLGHELLEDARRSLEDQGVTAEITGAQWNLYLGYSGIGEDLRKSVLFALGVILFVMALLFRSSAVPIIMLLPNAMPLLAGYAVLAIVGWQLSIVPAVVLALSVGIVVDDSIHMLARMREELRKHRALTDAVRYAIVTSGRAITISTLVLVAGFVVNGLSRFPINQSFALVGSTVLIAALVCDLLLLPALLILWHRRFPESEL